MSTVTVNVRLFRIEKYLRKLYPIHNAIHPHAKVRLLLANNDERSSKPCSSDITNLFISMAQNEHFICEVAQVSQDHELALAEAKELEVVLRDASRKAKPFLASFVSVRLSMREAGWRNSKPYNLYDDNQRPSIQFTFKEHQELPGEWPWYGALSLNHESLLLWKKWLEDSGVSGLQRWHVDVMVQPDVKEVTRSLTIWIDEHGYAKPRQGYIMRVP